MKSHLQPIHAWSKHCRLQKWSKCSELWTADSQSTGSFGTKSRSSLTVAFPNLVSYDLRGRYTLCSRLEVEDLNLQCAKLTLDPKGHCFWVDDDFCGRKELEIGCVVC